MTDTMTASRLNAAALDNIRALQRPGRPDILRRVIMRYLESTPELLQSLREAIQRNDPQAMYMAAHNLKSSSANLGALELAELSRQLETLGRQHSTEGVTELLASVEAEYTFVESELVAGYLEGASV